MEDILKLTEILQEFRNIYIGVVFALLGFVVSRKGYNSIQEKWIIIFSFSAFAFGNCYQILQTSLNIQYLITNCDLSWFKSVSPTNAVVSHLIADFGVIFVLTRIFKVKVENA